MTLIEKYQTYREAGKGLNRKAMEKCLDRRSMMKAAKLLGIEKRGVLNFQNKEDMDILADFALNERLVKGKSAIQIYHETVGAENQIEADLLRSLLQARTSLFEIISVSEPDCMVVLEDLLNEHEGVALIDINLSETVIPGYLLFLRPIEMDEFAMTSGAIFVFPKDAEQNLIFSYRKLGVRAKTLEHSVKRFVCFYKLSKKYGLGMVYE